MMSLIAAFFFRSAIAQVVVALGLTLAALKGWGVYKQWTGWHIGWDEATSHINKENEKLIEHVDSVQQKAAQGDAQEQLTKEFCRDCKAKKK